ncbi:MAG: hypothetical protein JSV52_03975 [Candidatus Zixiibacteriota bacterium]|nr:MAG: hypothetical protein JSV52_03975 [candidate division Zixibacteria bacterium]
MIDRKLSKQNAPIQIIGRWAILLVSLVLFAGCSDDSVGPEPQPELQTVVEGISYFDYSSGDLKYVEKRGDYWGNPEVVTYGGRVGWYSSLAFDAQGIPHISYYDETNQDLMYAIKTSEGWRRFTVDYTGHVGMRCAMALDAQGFPHISYIDADRNVKYASLVSGVWKSETLPGLPMYETDSALCQEAKYSWYSTSIAVDASGYAHIAYRTHDGRLGYAVKTAGGGWSFETVGNDIAGYQCPLALDVQGNPHICHLVSLGDDTYSVKYVWKNSGVWSADTITVGDGIHWCAQYADIAMDATGNPHIGFFTGTEHLGYLTKSVDDEWSYEDADGYGKVGMYVSIAVDAQGNPRISYYDSGNECLRYALKVGSGWGVHLVDQSSNVGFFNSLALSNR